MRICLIGQSDLPDLRRRLEAAETRVDYLGEAELGLDYLEREVVDAFVLTDNDLSTSASEWVKRAREKNKETVGALRSFPGGNNERRLLITGADCLIDADDPAEDVLDTIENAGKARRAWQLSRASDEAKRVMVVDDDDDALPILSLILERAGYSTLSVANPFEALEKFRNGPQHVLVSDLVMDGLTGTELIASIRRFDPAIAALVITGYPTVDAAVSAFQKGAGDFVAKPLEPSQLVAVVERAWKRWQAAEESNETSDSHQLLLVEDSATDAEIVTQHLRTNKASRWEIVWVESLAAALDELESNDFDIILLDLGLPDSDGIASFARLHAMCPQIPTVVLTAEQDEDLAERLIALGAQDYISKVFGGPIDVADRLLYAIERHKALSALDNLATDLNASDASRLQILQQANEAMVIIDQAGSIMVVNRAAEDLFGQDRATLLRRRFPFEPVLGAVAPVVLENGDGAIDLQMESEATNWASHRATVVTLRRTTNQSTTPDQVRSLTVRLAEANRKLERLATRDPLTEVLNRRGLEASLSQELARARRSGGSLCACLIDCDNFKSINDSLGHAVGDVVLTEIARRLVASTRETDTVGRVGGDEFLVLLPETRLAEGYLVAERARIGVGLDSVLSNVDPVSVTVSIGVASVPLETSSVQEVLFATHDALRTSKGLGKDRVSSSEEVESTPMRALVRSLVGDGEIRTVAQPIIELKSNRVVGVELLSRGPDGPLHQPSQFLRAARSENLLTAVDLHCLKAAISSASAFPPEWAVHVNVFPTTLLEVSTEELGRLVDGVKNELCLELSEEQFIGDPNELVDRLAYLKELGIKIAIDDVGKGRGTFDSVMLLEPEVAKIDRQIVASILTDGRSARLFKRLLLLSESLGCQVVAEGVESQSIADELARMGTTHAQGFHWAEPMPVAEAIRIYCESGD